VKFVLEAVDSSTGCVELDVMLHFDNVEELCKTLGIDSSGFNPVYPVRIRPPNRMDSLPYKVHTNRELSLMLKGNKPLAVFFDVCSRGSEAEAISEERLFEPYVAAGRFTKRVQDGVRIKGSDREHRRVLYAQPGEEWRIEAYLLMDKVAVVPHRRDRPPRTGSS